MIHEISEILSNKVSEFNGVTDTDKREVITYGFEAIISTAMSVLTVLTLSVVFNKILECIAFLAAFMPLRTYSGGYHASTHIRCIALLNAVFLIEMIIIYLYKSPSLYICWGLLVFSLFIIGILSPVENLNHPLSSKQMKDNRKRCIIVEIITVAVAVILTHLRCINLLFGYSYGIFVTAMSVVSEIVVNVINMRLKNHYFKSR